MQAEHFFYGLFPEEGSIRLVQSSKCDRILREDSLSYLYNLGRNFESVNEPIISLFPTEQVVAYSWITRRKDKLGRESPWNHTILVPYHEVFLDYQNRVKPFLQQQPLEPPAKMQPLNL